MVLYPHLDPVGLSLQPLLVAFPYQQGPDCLTKPRDCSGGAAVFSSQALLFRHNNSSMGVTKVRLQSGEGIGALPKDGTGGHD